MISLITVRKGRVFMPRKQKSIVKKSNILIRSRWMIGSLWEPRLVALLASKIQAEDEDFKTYRMSISELLEGTGHRRSGQTYDLIIKAVKNLMNRVIEMNEGSVTKLYAIFSSVKIDRSDGTIEMRFDSDLKSHYLQLKEKFTLYSLEEFMKLPSAYSQRIFEILSSWKNLPEGEKTIPIDELQEALDTPPSFRKDFKAFREKVLERAQKDIMANPESSLFFEWEAIKGGRGGKVVSIRFIFDARKIEQEKRRKEDEERKATQKRHNAIWMAARKCHSDPAASPPADEEVCQFCQRFFLPWRDCQWVRRTGATDRDN